MTLPTGVNAKLKMPTSPAIAPTAKPEIHALTQPKVLLLGEPGSGKTFSLGSLATKRKIVYLYSEPGGDESLIDGCRHYGAPISQLHWHYVPPAPNDFGALVKMAQHTKMKDYQALAKMGKQAGEYKAYEQILQQCMNFQCQRTGEELGSLDKLSPEYAVVFDSISSLNLVIREHFAGGKPTLHEGEWGIIMNIEETFIRQMVGGIRGVVVFLGHVEKTTDALGMTSYSAAFLGKKLASRGTIVRNFSDVIFTEHGKGGFTWATASDKIALKSRNLPLKDLLEPDFRVLLNRYEQRMTDLQA